MFSWSINVQWVAVLYHWDYSILPNNRPALLLEPCQNCALDLWFISVRCVCSARWVCQRALRVPSCVLRCQRSVGRSRCSVNLSQTVVDPKATHSSPPDDESCLAWNPTITPIKHRPIIYLGVNLLFWFGSKNLVNAFFMQSGWWLTRLRAGLIF